MWCLSQRLFLRPSQLIVKNNYHQEISIKSESLKTTTVNDEIFNKKADLNPIEEKIISCIKDDAKTIEEIGRKIHISQIDLIEYISIMEMEGIRRNPVPVKPLKNGYKKRGFSSV